MGAKSAQCVSFICGVKGWKSQGCRYRCIGDGVGGQIGHALAHILKHLLPSREHFGQNECGKLRVKGSVYWLIKMRAKTAL